MHLGFYETPDRTAQDLASKSEPPWASKPAAKLVEIWTLKEYNKLFRILIWTLKEYNKLLRTPNKKIQKLLSPSEMLQSRLQQLREQIQSLGVNFPFFT